MDENLLVVECTLVNSFSFPQLSKRYWHVKHLQCDNIQFSPRYVGFRSTTYFLTRASKKHQCPGLNWVPNAATSLALYKQVSASPFFVHSMSLNIDMNMFLSSKGSRICPFKHLRMYFLMSGVEAPGNTCQMNCTSRATKFNCSKNPCSFHTSSNFVAQ